MGLLFLVFAIAYSATIAVSAYVVAVLLKWLVFKRLKRWCLVIVSLVVGWITPIVYLYIQIALDTKTFEKRCQSLPDPGPMPLANKKILVVRPSIGGVIGMRRFDTRFEEIQIREGDEIIGYSRVDDLACDGPNRLKLYDRCFSRRAVTDEADLVYRTEHDTVDVSWLSHISAKAVILSTEVNESRWVELTLTANYPTSYSGFFKPQRCTSADIGEVEWLSRLETAG